MQASYFEEIKAADISTFIGTHVEARSLAPKTANRYREILCRLFNWAAQERGVRLPGGKNPVAQVRRYREGAPRIRFLTLDEVCKQLEVLKDHAQLQTMVAMLIYAGLRREELLWLTIDDVDYAGGANGVIRVRAKDDTVKISSEIVPADAMNDYLDEFGRVERLQYLDGTSVQTQYGCCWLESVTDRQGIVTTYAAPDSLNRITAITTASGTSGALTTLYSYDAVGRTTQIKRKGTDNVEHIVQSRAYDPAGRIIAVTDASLKGTYYTYGLITDSGTKFMEARHYPYSKLLGPITASWTDGAGQTVRTFGASTAAADWSPNRPTGSEALTGLTRGTFEYDWRGRTTKSSEYYDLASAAYDTINVYDGLDHLIRTTSPLGDITATVYNVVDYPISQWRGTNASNATPNNPDNGGAPNNMKMISASFYDTVMDGSGYQRPFVTRTSKLKPEATLQYLDTDYLYHADTQRLEWIRPASGGGLWTQTTYDSVGKVVDSITTQNGNIAVVLAKTTNVYDTTTQRISAQRVYNVSGTGYLETTYDYDAAGRKVKTTRLLCLNPPPAA